MKKSLVFLFCFVSSLSLFADGIPTELIGSIKDGELKLVKLGLPNGSANMTGKIFNLDFPFFIYKNNAYSIIAAPLGVSNGEYLLTINSSSGKIAELTVPVTSRVDIKTEEVLDTPEDSVLPKQGATIERITREDVELKNVFKVFTPVKLWENKFIEPVKGIKNSPFGIYRVYSNHLRRRTH
jgi:hypothetical protein